MGTRTSAHRTFLALVAAAVSIAAQAQGDPETVTRILDEGKNRNQVMNHLTHLTTKIGPRLTGSPQLQHAVDWAVSRFKAFGLQNAHADEWGEVPAGFSRGRQQSVRMVAPYTYDFQFTTPAWYPGTKGKVTGKVIPEPKTLADFAKVEQSLKGSWILMEQPIGMRGATAGVSDEAKQIQEKIAAIDIAGRIYGTSSELVHTSGRWTFDLKNPPQDVVIYVRKSDAEQMRWNIGQGREVKVEANIENTIILHPVKVYNVIADIPGTEKPDEYVIISGHLDSWNGPGSQGAVDNGTGSCVTLEAARILMKAGAKPKRTIRFVLWTGEEQGLHGSRKYVEKYKADLDKISAVFVDDGGTNYQGGVPCVEQMKPMLEAAMAPMAAAFPQFPQKIDVLPAMPRGGGSDHASFNAVGVPGFFWYETGRADYRYAWHTQNDRLDQAIPEYLVQSSTNSAVVAYNIACAETLLPRQTPAQAQIFVKAPTIGSKHDHDDLDHDHDMHEPFVPKKTRAVRKG
ncbi:MAG: M20/M25/M40 family metallo-hydrolase [Fimbriimonadaceae bacterium]|nr:M20/M25/M40 family metallo-hydrolase [Fimbriimonadaceae bacterium]